MTELTKLTIAQARDQMAKGAFTASELTEAHIRAMEAKRDLNAYITETADLAREQAKASDLRRQAGKAGALEGIPLGIKDLFCTKGGPDHRRQPHPARLQARLMKAPGRASCSMPAPSPWASSTWTNSPWGCATMTRA
uniref:Glutamyl-tRNA(Gln) amidotransferase, A subunit n=1 Tax=Magnetospirillum gryphiswaldense TaxID=55518 RepID=A4TW07_9PROT|nr:glutamyl-tRNA(Gln) amidotransferase, A subunit [Magnetospirillum gryphiswaldense MSR-1]